MKIREAEVRKKETAIEAERTRLQERADALLRAEAQQIGGAGEAEAQASLTRRKGSPC